MNSFNLNINLPVASNLYSWRIGDKQIGRFSRGINDALCKTPPHSQMKQTTQNYHVLHV